MATSRIACDTKLPARDARCATTSGAPLGATGSYHPYDLWLKQSTMLWRSDASEISLRSYGGRQLGNSQHGIVRPVCLRPMSAVAAPSSDPPLVAKILIPASICSMIESGPASS